MVLAVVILAVAFAAAAWARERSELLSEQELNEIEVIAQTAFPKDIKAHMVVSDDVRGEYVLIEFFSSDDKLLLWIEAYPIEASVFLGDLPDQEIADAAGKIIKGVENILNRSPQDVFRKILS